MLELLLGVSIFMIVFFYFFLLIISSDENMVLKLFKESYIAYDDSLMKRKSIKKYLAKILISIYFRWANNRK